MEHTLTNEASEEIQSFSVSDLIRHTKWTWKYCKMLDRGFAPMFFVFNLLSNVKGIGSTLVYGFLMNAIAQFSTQGFNSVSAWQAFGVYSGYHMFEGLLEMFQSRYISDKKRAIELQLKRAFLHKLARLNLNRLDKTINNEKFTEEYLNSTIVYSHYTKSISLVSDMITAVTLLGIIAYFAWPLSLIMTALAIPRFWIDKYLRRNYAAAQKRAAPIGKGLKRVTAVWLDRMTLKMAIAQKATGLLDEKYVEIQKQWRKMVGTSYNRWQSANRIIDLVNGLVSIMGFAWVLFKNSHLSAIGYIYVQLQMIRMLQAKLKQLAVNYNALEESCGKLVAVQKAFGWEEIDNNRNQVSVETVGIELRNVFFNKLESAVPEAMGLSVKFGEGEKTDLIVYESPIAEMLGRSISGLNKPVAGEVLAGETPIEGMPLGMSVGIPGAYFLSLSVKENITLKTDWEEENVTHVLELAGLTRTVANLPQKADQILAEMPEAPSSDLIGRILLARILYAKPKWAVWVSPLKISSRAEGEIFSALYKFIPSVITITDKISSSRLAGRVILLKRGKIIEEGSPDELIARGGDYAKAWERLQANTTTNTNPPSAQTPT